MHMKGTQCYGNGNMEDKGVIRTNAAKLEETSTFFLFTSSEMSHLLLYEPLFS